MMIIKGSTRLKNEPVFCLQQCIQFSWLRPPLSFFLRSSGSQEQGQFLPISLLPALLPGLYHSQSLWECWQLLGTSLGIVQSLASLLNWENHALRRERGSPGLGGHWGKREATWASDHFCLSFWPIMTLPFSLEAFSVSTKLQMAQPKRFAPSGSRTFSPQLCLYYAFDGCLGLQNLKYLLPSLDRVCRALHMQSLFQVFCYSHCELLGDCILFQNLSSLCSSCS